MSESTLTQEIRIFKFGDCWTDEECWVGRSFTECLAAFLLSRGASIADVAAQLHRLGEDMLAERFFEFEESDYDDKFLNDIDDPASGFTTYRQVIEEIDRDKGPLPFCISVTQPEAAR